MLRLAADENLTNGIIRSLAKQGTLAVVLCSSAVIFPPLARQT
jgi:hypothetical protein